MKKIMFGAIMFLAGMLSMAILLAGAMAHEWTIDDRFSAFWNLTNYGLMPVFYTFVAVAVIGLIIAIWGMLEKK